MLMLMLMLLPPDAFMFNFRFVCSSIIFSLFRTLWTECSTYFFQTFLRPKMLIMFILHFDSFWMKNNLIIVFPNSGHSFQCAEHRHQQQMLCVKAKTWNYDLWLLTHITSSTEMQLFASLDHFPVSEKAKQKYSHGNKANERNRKCVRHVSFGIQFHKVSNVLLRRNSILKLTNQSHVTFAFSNFDFRNDKISLCGLFEQPIH